MIKKKSRNSVRLKRHQRIRNKISGTSECPRLSIYRSNTNIYAQVIDDVAGKTLASYSTIDKKYTGEKKANIESAKVIGKEIAEQTKALGINKVVFDRSGYLYHGKIKALADAAREAGLEF